MADNLSQYRTRIRRYLRETDADKSFWTDLFLNQMFNASYRQRCVQMILAYEGWFTLAATTDLVADQSAYGFPSGLQRLLKVELVRTDGSRDPLERWERHDERLTVEALTGDSYWANYRPFSNGLVLEPTPQETVSDGLRIEYTGLPAKLSGDSDTIHPSFPDILDELLVLDTVVLALQAEGINETGPQAAIVRMREEWGFDFTRFIERRVEARDRIDPFIASVDLDT